MRADEDDAGPTEGSQDSGWKAERSLFPLTDGEEAPGSIP
jgi:hypothetical protein